MLLTPSFAFTVTTLATHAMREIAMKSLSASYGSDFFRAGSDANVVDVTSSNV